MCQMPFVVHGFCRMTIVMINPLNLYCSTTVKVLYDTSQHFVMKYISIMKI